MKPRKIRKTRSILFPIVVMGVICAAVLAPASPAAEPVGAKITAIDAKTGMVTAKETTTGRAFQFQVKDAALLKSLKVGQKISADLKAMTVMLSAARPGAKAVQVRILKAEPVGRPAEPVGQPQATGQAAQVTTKPGGIKSASVNFSVLTSSVQAVNPLLLLPDLVPTVFSAIASCDWNESLGETCESKCPPRDQAIPLGTKNISQRPLSGPVRIRVLAHPSGTVLRDWTVTDLPGNGTKTPGSIIKTWVFCGEGGVSTYPEPNHKLVVETNANEADKNNNTKLMYIGPLTHTQLGP